MEPRLREWGSGWSLGSGGVGKWVEPGLRGSGEVGGVWAQREWGSGWSLGSEGVGKWWGLSHATSVVAS